MHFVLRSVELQGHGISCDQMAPKCVVFCLLTCSTHSKKCCIKTLLVGAYEDTYMGEKKCTVTPFVACKRKFEEEAVVLFTGKW